LQSPYGRQGWNDQLVGVYEFLTFTVAHATRHPGWIWIALIVGVPSMAALAARHYILEHPAVKRNLPGSFRGLLCFEFLLGVRQCVSFGFL
jgi:hypothetical protein